MDRIAAALGHTSSSSVLRVSFADKVADLDGSLTFLHLQQAVRVCAIRGEDE